MADNCLTGVARGPCPAEINTFLTFPLTFLKHFCNIYFNILGDVMQPGVARGPCPADSGKPSDVENQQADATVVFSNVG